MHKGLEEGAGGEHHTASAIERIAAGANAEHPSRMRAAARAASVPAWPAPTTITSKSKINWDMGQLHLSRRQIRNYCTDPARSLMLLVWPNWYPALNHVKKVYPPGRFPTYIEGR